MSTYRDQLAALLRDHSPSEFTSTQIAEALHLTRAQVTDILTMYVKDGHVLKHSSTGRNQLYCWNTEPGANQLRNFQRATAACQQLVLSARHRTEQGGTRAQ